MADFLQFVSMLREQMNATLSRSDILRPLSWLLALLLSTELISLYFKMPEWFSILVASFLVIAIALYLIVYGYSAFKQPDVLRSEKYSLHKMAIEHGLYGDNRTGLMEPEPPSARMKAIQAAPVTESEAAQ